MFMAHGPWQLNSYQVLAEECGGGEAHHDLGQIL
jgi:hypothetical protein